MIIVVLGSNVFNYDYKNEGLFISDIPIKIAKIYILINYYLFIKLGR
jgi:hypothetical protein